jgi:hypothetical protein
MTPHPLLRLACFASELCAAVSGGFRKVVELYKREDDIPEDGAE